MVPIAMSYRVVITMFWIRIRGIRNYLASLIRIRILPDYQRLKEISEQMFSIRIHWMIYYLLAAVLWLLLWSYKQKNIEKTLTFGWHLYSHWRKEEDPNP
jgi:hypothetical protein